MQVIKRTGIEVEFDKDKIINAINKAANETELGIDMELSVDIADSIEDDIRELDIIPNIEVISNMVEEYLMDSDRKDIAKKYILYRDERNRLRNTKLNSNYKFITDDFVSKYKHKKPPFTNLGHFVYLRTYSRWLPEENRREYWWETVRRAVEYNCSLVPDITQQEAEKLYDNIFNLRQFLSGRTLYTGGTEASKKYPMSNYNCSFTIANDFEAFKDLFYLLLIGAGVGLRVKKEDVDQLPLVRGDFKIIHKAYAPTPKKDRKEYTAIDFEDNMVEIFVGDSKEAWCQALEYFLRLFYLNEFSKVNTIIMNYDNVRQTGERLKTFGGYASGYKPFMEMIDKIYKVLVKDNTYKKKLKPIDCLDIANIIGVSVVSGGVRRCLPKGSLVHTDKGLIPIEEIKVADKVMTSDGYHEVTDWVYQGKQELLTIETQMGEFKCTPKHKIAVMNNVGKYEWVYAKDLKENDRMVFVNNIIDGIETEFPKYNHIKKDKDTNSVDIIIPQLDNNMAWFLGYLHGNGYVSKKEVNISIPITNPNIKDKVEQQLLRFNINILHKPIKGKYFVIGAKSVQLAEFLSQYKKPSVEMIVPKIILNAKPEIRASYLTGLYDADGTSKNNPVIAVTSIYPKYLKQIQSLYSSLGIPSRLKLKRKAKNNWKELYVLTIVGEKVKKDFESIIANNSLKYQNCCQTSRSQNDYGYPSNWVKNIKNNGLWNKNTKQMTMATYERITGEKQNLIPIKVLGTKYNKDIDETYDISVDSVCEFVCEGFLVHNTSEVILFDYNDEETYKAKTELYKEIDGQWILDDEISHRRMSNNSIQYDKKPSREQWHKNIQEMRVSGEPAFQNLESAKKRREDAEGGNPCMEILLRNRGMCNLTEINVLGFVDNGKLNYEALYKAQRLSARAGYRMACINFELYKWDRVNKEDMLIGCGLTGWQDMINTTNIGEDEEIELLKKLKQIAHDSANELADKLGRNRPKLYTTIKPSGTLSQLPTVSSGVHFSHSPYYIRRVRINAFDPLVQVIKELQYPMYPEVGQTMENCDTIVIEFPVKSPTGKTKFDVSAIEQLEIYKKFMKYYVDHNTSITVHVRNNEWEEVEQWVWDNWDDVVAISFLSLDDNFYQLMPYEEISEEEYNRRITEMKIFNPSLLNKYEKEEVEIDIGSSDCSGGMCPVR